MTAEGAILWRTVLHCPVLSVLGNGKVGVPDERWWATVVQNKFVCMFPRQYLRRHPTAQGTATQTRHSVKCEVLICFS